jgi:CRISPR-associated protein Csm3
LGGGGSRGSGRIRFSGISAVWRGRSYYASGGDEASLATGLDAGGLQKLVNGPDFGSGLNA